MNAEKNTDTKRQAAQPQTAGKQVERMAGFELGSLGGIALTLVVAGLLIAFGLQILGDVKADMTADSSEANATADTITGVGKLSAKMPIIGTIVVAVLIIGLLVRGWGGMGR